MKDDQKPFKLKMTKKNSKWKTTKINGRPPMNSKGKKTKKFKMEDDQKEMEDKQNKFNWKTTKKWKMENNKNKLKFKTTQKKKYGR